MKKCSFKEEKEILNGILKYFDYLCTKYNLNYSLYAGTLLGAARHNGFIPWDDDLDVIMPLDDYNNFLKIPEINNHNNKYVLHYRTTEKMNDEKYYYPFAKLEDSNTVSIYRKTFDKGGAFIDIFPIGGLPNTKAQRETYYSQIVKLHNSISNVASKFRNPYWKLYGFLHRRYYSSYRDKLIELQNQINFEESIYVGQTVWLGDGEKRIFPRKWFDSYSLLTFEGKNYKVISNYQECLELAYGDWKRLPPKTQQVPHHNYDLYVKK